MDKKHTRTTIGGVGVGCLMALLQMAPIQIPISVLIIGGIITVCMIGYGIWPGLEQIEKLGFRSPLYIKASVSSLKEPTQKEDHPLIIDFNPNDCFTDSEVQAKIGIDLVKKREYWFFVTAKKEISGLSVEVEKREVLPNRPNEIFPLHKPIYVQLKFEGSPQTKIDVSKGQKIKVLFVERTRGFPNHNSEPIIFTNTSVSFYNNNMEHHVHIKITGKGINPIGEVFSVWGEENGNLRVGWPMVRLI